MIGLPATSRITKAVRSIVGSVATRNTPAVNLSTSDRADVARRFMRESQPTERRSSARNQALQHMVIINDRRHLRHQNDRHQRMENWCCCRNRHRGVMRGNCDAMNWSHWRPTFRTMKLTLNLECGPTTLVDQCADACDGHEAVPSAKSRRLPRSHQESSGTSYT